MVISILTLLLAGSIAFSANSKGDPEKDALVFGCFDLSEINSYIDNISFIKYPPRLSGFMGFPHDINIYFIHKSGYYIADQVKPGQYWLMGFYTRPIGLQFQNKVTNCQVTYKPTEADVFTVKEGDIYYYGTYKYRVAEKGQFALEKVDTPSEKELLQNILESMKGTKWEAKIQERLASL